jgi:hypothetical protein
VVALDPVIACLRRSVRGGKVTTATHELDSIARRAGRGAVVVRFGVSKKVPHGLNLATVVLERSADDARITEDRYRSVYKALGSNGRDVLLRTDNAVVAFGARPLPHERRWVTGCLRPTA